MKLDKFRSETEGLLRFIQSSPTAFHAVDTAKRMLSSSGFRELNEDDEFNIEPGSEYYVVRNDSSVIAFKLPEKVPTGFEIICAHTDSPLFKLKANPEIRKEFYTSLNVERYGGMILSQWFDRPLSVAGRVFIKNGKNGIKSVLFNEDRDLCLIPSLCIHFNRESNKDREYDVQKEMIPVISQSFDNNSSFSLRKSISDFLNIDEKEILDADLFLYNRQEGRIWGADNEFFSAPRIDNLMCSYAALRALIEADCLSDGKVRMVCLFDNEEVGSLTYQGADGDFFSQILHRLCCCYRISEQQKYTVQANSFMLSADNGHAFHPNYPEKIDPTNHVFMNNGVVVKFSANQKYTTDAYSSSVVRLIMENRDIPYQLYFNHSNIIGGSTLGNILQSHFSVPTVDVGAAQLSMHSPYETAGVMDTTYLFKFFSAFFSDFGSVKINR